MICVVDDLRALAPARAIIRCSLPLRLSPCPFGLGARLCLARSLVLDLHIAPAGLSDSFDFRCGLKQPRSAMDTTLRYIRLSNTSRA